MSRADLLSALYPLVVVEGPDNAGKTTLIVTLAKQLRAVAMKIERLPQHVGDVETYHEAVLNVNKQYRYATVLDRHPAISEPIYGSIIRGSHCLEFYSRVVERCVNDMDWVIICLPPKDRVIGTLAERDQMPGVIDNIVRIYDRYHDDYLERCEYPASKFVHYDYTQHTIGDLCARILERSRLQGVNIR